MSLMVREFDHFVLDGRTVAWSYTGDLAAEKRGFIQMFSDYLVCFWIGVTDITENLVLQFF